MTEKFINYLTALKHYEKTINAISKAQCIDDLVVDCGDFLEMALNSNFAIIRDAVLSHFTKFYADLWEQAQLELLESNNLDLLLEKISEKPNEPS